MSGLDIVAQQATQTPANLSSASSNITNGFGDLSAVLPVAVLLVVIIIGLVSSVRFYRLALKASGRFATSLEYAIKGVVTAAVLAVFAAPLYLLATMDAGTRSLLYRGAVLVVAGYFALVALGYVGERVWGRIVSQHEAATGNHPLDRFDTDDADQEVAD